MSKTKLKWINKTYLYTKISEQLSAFVSIQRQLSLCINKVTQSCLPLFGGEAKFYTKGNMIFAVKICSWY